MLQDARQALSARLSGLAQKAGVLGNARSGKIYSNAAWLMVDKIIRMCVGILVISLVTRYLGPELFGVWNYALAVVAIFTSVAGMGLDTIVIREIVRNPSKSGEILGSAAAIKAVSAVFAVALAVGSMMLLKPGDEFMVSLVFIAALGLLFNAFDVIDFFFQSQTLSKYVVCSRNAAFLLFSLVKIGLVFASAPLVAFVFAGSAEAAVAALFMLIMYRKSERAPRAWSARVSTMKRLLRESWPLLFAGLAIMLYMRIDQVMLGYLSTEGEVGIYSAAVRLSEMWYFIPTSIASSIFPTIIRIRDESPSRLDETMRKYYAIMAFIGISASIFIYFASADLVNILFGPRFSGSTPVLVIHIWCGVFVCLGTASSSWLVANNLQQMSLIRTVIGCLINIAINFYAIPRYGAVGASVATLLSYAAATFSLIISKESRSQGIIMIKSLFFPIHLKEFMQCLKRS